MCFIYVFGYVDMLQHVQVTQDYLLSYLVLYYIACITNHETLLFHGNDLTATPMFRQHPLEWSLWMHKQVCYSIDKVFHMMVVSCL